MPSTDPIAAAPGPDDFRVHVHSAGARGLFTNAFLVETSHSVIAVDAMMTVSDARGLRARAHDLGKPLVAVLITHGHPDHYNGVSELLEARDVPVIATEGVHANIRRIDDAKEVQWRPIYGDDWPAVRTFPNHLVRDGDRVTFDGVPFTVRELGAGESHCDTYWRVGDRAPAVFLGDLVFPAVHSYLSDGHSTAWLRSLDVVQHELADAGTAYIGHGPAATLAEMVTAQRRYLTEYRDAVRQLSGGSGSMDEPSRRELVRRMKAVLPTEDLEAFIAAGANAVAAELA